MKIDRISDCKLVSFCKYIFCCVYNQLFGEAGFFFGTCYNAI